jgi:P-type Ca2+ transporter type 2C
VNLVTDSLPALALSAEKEEPGIMRRPPRDPKEGILTSRTTILMVSQGVMVGVVTLAAFLITLQLFSYDVTRAQTAAFVTLTLSELLRAFSFRTELVSVWRQGVFGNRWMIGAMLASAALLFAVVYLPSVQPWFNTTTLGPTEWTYIGPLVLLPFLMAEAAKVLMKRQGR